MYFAIYIYDVFSFSEYVIGFQKQYQKGVDMIVITIDIIRTRQI